jgi:hypothetical protein
MGFGVALRLTDPAVLRTGCIARRTGLGNNPRRRLIHPLTFYVAVVEQDAAPTVTEICSPGDVFHKKTVAEPAPFVVKLHVSPASDAVAV